MRRNATTTVPEQILTILERHSRRAKPAAEGVFEIVDPDLPKPLRWRFAMLLYPRIRGAFRSRYGFVTLLPLVSVDDALQTAA